MSLPPPATLIQGVYETHLPVRDLARSLAFYRDRLGLPLALEIPERRLAFLWLCDKSQGMLGLWEKDAPADCAPRHFAFRTSRAGIFAACDHLAAAGIQPVGFVGEAITEPVVFGWMPAASVYFRDPDGHSVELIHLLDAAPDPDFGIRPYSDWWHSHCLRSAASAP